MEIKVNVDQAMAVALFDQRFTNYHPNVRKTEKIYQQCDSHSMFGGQIETLFESMSKFTMPNGAVHIGVVGKTDMEDGTRFIFIRSKVGSIIVYKDGSTIKWITEDSYSKCASAIREGYGANAGTVASYAQMDHLFKIPDSYADTYRF